MSNQFANELHNELEHWIELLTNIQELATELDSGGNSDALLDLLYDQFPDDYVLDIHDSRQPKKISLLMRWGLIDLAADIRDEEQ